MSPERFAITAGRVRHELGDLDRLFDRLRTVSARARVAQIDREVYFDAVALYLHDLYVGVECILVLVSEGVDDTMPRGDHWRLKLLEQARVPVRGLRPEVFSEAQFALLDELRRFRQVVRHVYTFDFEQDRIAALADRVVAGYPAVRADFARFAEFLDGATP